MKQVTIEEARKILGKKVGADLKDEELQRIILDLEVIARDTLKAIEEDRSRFNNKVNL